MHKLRKEPFMSNQPRSVLSHELANARQAFIARVITAATPACHTLLAPPGTGKHIVAVEVIQQVAHTHRECRVLFISRKILVPLIARQIATRVDAIRPDVVDRHLYRELEAGAIANSSPFAPASAVIMSFESAGHKDVIRGILSTRWDLVVIDESHQKSGSWNELIESLFSSNRADRVILMSASPISTTGFAVTSATDWTSLVSLRPIFDPPVVRVVAVPWTSAEQAVLKGADELAAELRLTGAKFDSSRTVSAARSSFLALESSLRVLRSKPLLRLSRAVQSSDSYEPSADEQGEVRASLPWVRERVDGLLTAMDDIETDSKTEALASLVSQRLGSDANSAIAVVSRFSATVRYLAEVLSNRGIVVRTIADYEQSMDFSKLVEDIVKPGVTILPYFAYEGFDFNKLGTWIFYEKISNLPQMSGTARTLRRFDPARTEVFEFDDPLPTNAELVDER